MAESMVHGNAPIPSEIHWNVPHRFCVMARDKDGQAGIRKGWLYVPLFTVYHGLTMQTLVIYAGLDGPDEGKRFACSLADWALKFFEEPAGPTAGAPAPELPALSAEGKAEGKAAGHKSTSAGV